MIVKKENMNFSDENIVMIISGLPGTGKACADDTDVFTDKGFVKIKDLCVGDKVYGEDGNLHSVLGVYPQGVRPSYLVTFNDGVSVVCDIDHLWTVRANLGNARKTGWRTYSTAELLKKGIVNDSPSRAATGRKPILKWEVPLTVPFNAPEQNFLIAPYIMGVLLGDGCLSGGQPIFSNPDFDSEIKDKVATLLPDGYSLTRHETDCPSYYIKSANGDNKIAQYIRANGLDTKAIDKYTPPEYFMASAAQRLELLRGLMDTDGGARENRVSFNTISETLAEDVAYLTRSLGGIAKIRSYDRTSDGKGIEYAVNVKMPVCPFSLPRKAKEWHPYIISRHIRSIEKVNDVSCTCIKVDNPSELFVIKDFIVTHNTTLGFSAPDAVLIDCDKGVKRTNPAHRSDAISIDTLENLEADIHSPEMKAYKTIIFDTCGQFIELLKDWAVRTCKGAAKNGGGISLQGYGFVKTKFLEFTSELRKSYNIIYLFHTLKDKDSEGNIIYDLICEGATKQTVWIPVDLGAYLQILNGERVLCFTPTEQYSAKSAYGIKGRRTVPELKDGDKNDFLTRLFAEVKANMAKDAEANKAAYSAYDEVMAAGKAIIEKVTSLEDINAARTALRALKHVLTTEKELGAALKTRLAELKIVWNAAKKAYEQQ